MPKKVWLEIVVAVCVLLSVQAASAAPADMKNIWQHYLAGLPEAKLLLAGDYFNVYSLSDPQTPQVVNIAVADNIFDNYLHVAEVKPSEVNVDKEKGIVTIATADGTRKHVLSKSSYIFYNWLKLQYFPQNDESAGMGYVYFDNMKTITLTYVDQDGNIVHQGLGEFEVMTPASIALVTEKHTVAIAIKEPGYKLFFDAIAFPGTVGQVGVMCAMYKPGQVNNATHFLVAYRTGQHPELAHELMYGRPPSILPVVLLVLVLITLGVFVGLNLKIV